MNNILYALKQKFEKMLKDEYKFKYFEIHLTEHCNLNCQSCFHFSPLADEEYTDINDFEKDFKRLSELAGGGEKIESLILMGGEPLLHPKCIEFFPVARKYFPKSDIQFVTNGVLLPVQNEDFWLAMQKSNIILRPTKYPVNIDWSKIEETAQNYNIKVHYFNNIKISAKIPICINGVPDIKKNYNQCRCKTCYILNKGRIYPCSVAANIHHFIKYFKLNIENSPKNGIDIYKVKNINQIDKFLKKKIPVCKYCNGSGYKMFRKWQVSNKDINEWI